MHEKCVWKRGKLTKREEGEEAREVCVECNGDWGEGRVKK